MRRSVPDGPRRTGSASGRGTVAAMPRTRTSRTALLVATVLLLGTACAGSDPAPTATALDDDAITIGSFDFPESTLLAELYAQALEGHGFTVDRRFGLGPRELVLPALQRGL